MSEEKELYSRMGRVETHVEYCCGRLDVLEGKIDLLLARPSTVSQIASFVATHWKALLIVALTLSGAGWAPPLLAALK